MGRLKREVSEAGRFATLAVSVSPQLSLPSYHHFIMHGDLFSRPFTFRICGIGLIFSTLLI